MKIFTICGTAVKISAQYRPNVAESQPKVKTPLSAPIAKILPTHEAWLDVNGVVSGDSSICSRGRKGDVQPIEAPTPRAMMFTAGNSIFEIFCGS